MIGPRGDISKKIAGIDNPVRLRKQIVGSHIKGCRREAAGVQPNVPGGSQKLEEVGDLERVTVT